MHRTLAENGFCDFETVNATLVQYSWPETIAGDESRLPCALGPNSSASDMGIARRFCNGTTAEWEEPSLEECLNGTLLQTLIIST